MKRLAVCLVAFAFTLPLAPQTAPLPRYKVVRNSKEKAAAAEWNAAADQGYRLLFEARVAVMRRDTAPPDTYRYMPLPDRSLRATFLNALNEQGAFGYAWLPQTRMLEKLPHPRTYEYAVVEGFAAKTRSKSLEDLRTQGFRSIGRFGSVPIYIRETGADSTPPSGAPGERLLDRTNHRKLLKQIVADGRQGYRYHGNTITDKGDMVLMEECGTTCGGPFEYRSCDVKSGPQLEKDLNSLGAQGFRLVTSSLDFPPSLLERSATPAQFSYRVAEAKDRAALERFINDGDRDGFVPIAFAARVGWTVKLMIVLEKATASASAQP